MNKIELTQEEIGFLENYVRGNYNALVAPIKEQDIELALIEKATIYEEENNLVDERIDFSPDCDILKWYYHRYNLQKEQ